MNERMVSPVKMFYMSVWRNFLTLKRYKANFLFSIVTSVVAGFGLLVIAVGIDTSVLGVAVGSTNYAAFVILGISYQSWQGIAMWRAAGIFQGELRSGQIDYTFSCPFSRYWYIVTNIAAAAVQETIFFSPMLCVGFWFTRETLTATGVFMGLLATMVSVVALAQLGAIFAALVLKYRQVTAIFGFFQAAFLFLTGMFVPLQLLPIPLQIAGYGLPMTFGMDLLRHYVMGTRPIMTIEYEWASLLAQLIVLALIAKLAIRHLEKVAKEEGLHYL